MEKSEVLIKFLLNFRQSGDVLFFLNVRRLRGYTATTSYEKLIRLGHSKHERRTRRKNLENFSADICNLRR